MKRVLKRIHVWIDLFSKGFSKFGVLSLLSWNFMSFTLYIFLFFFFFFTKPLQLSPPYVLFRFFKSIFDLSDMSELKNVEIQDADFVKCKTSLPRTMNVSH